MTVDRAFLARLRIEPLDRARHDRAAFRCGEDRIDSFLKSSAAGQQDQELTRVYVACIDDSAEIVAYYALNSHSIDASTLPEQVLKRLPRYPSISSVYLSVFGVDSRVQSRGIGSFMMADAFRRAVQVADIIGSYFIVLDALNERAAAMYRRLGFVDLPGHPPRMLMKMAQVRKAIAATPPPS